MTETISVLVADDHPVFRQGLHALLDGVQDIELIGEAADGDEAVVRALELKPDVVLMDVRMPGTNGIEATRKIVAADSGIGILVLTMFEDDDSVFAAMRAGARGYLLKGSEQDEVMRAIRSIASGEAIFGPAIARRLIGYFSAASTEAFPGAHRSRAGGLGADRPGAQQPGDRQRARAQPEDGPQSRLQRLQQASGHRPRRGDRQGPRVGHGSAPTLIRRASRRVTAGPAGTVQHPIRAPNLHESQDNSEQRNRVGMRRSNPAPVHTNSAFGWGPKGRWFKSSHPDFSLVIGVFRSNESR